MWLIVMLAAFILLAVPTSVRAQTGQPHVTETVSGPAVVYPGSDATFDITVEVDGPQSDIYITWAGPGPEFCCDYVSSSVISGQANLAGSAPVSVRWSVLGPKAVIRLVIHIKASLESGPLRIGGYLPGTNVGQYETINAWEAQVGTLPRTGGPPSPEGPHAATPIAAGIAMVLLSGACFAAAVRARCRQAIVGTTAGRGGSSGGGSDGPAR